MVVPARALTTVVPTAAPVVRGLLTAGPMLVGRMAALTVGPAEVPEVGEC
jgi:hypothetical protein